jgi:hypothetical protein
MWSFLSVVHPLRIPIPMCEKKIRVQQENSYKITYCMCISNLILAIHPQSVNGLEELFEDQAGKSSSSPRAAGVLVEPEFPSCT